MLSSRGKDYVSAVLLVLAGAAATVAGRSYKVGSLTEMGAGFLPTLIGLSLIVVGLLIAATSSPVLAHEPSRTVTPEASPFDLRGWGFIVGGLASFVLLGTYGGFVPASFACVFISALADRQNSIKDAAILAVVIAAAGYLIFHVGLRLQFDAFTWG
jgi:hypothetical protein